MRTPVSVRAPARISTRSALHGSTCGEGACRRGTKVQLRPDGGSSTLRQMECKKALLALAAMACAALAWPAIGQKQQAPSEEDLLARAAQPWTGDLDGMIERRVVRALVAPARMEYWIDRGRQNGAEYELLTKFEEELNRQYKTKGKHLRIHVAFIPTARDRLLPALLEGRGDIAAGILTVT